MSETESVGSSVAGSTSPQYTRYKDSGVDWLSDIPSHWSVIPLKYVAEIEGSGTWGEDPNESTAGVETAKIPVARVSDVGWNGQVLHEEMPMRKLAADKVSQYSCRPGDILIVKASGSAKNIVTGRAAQVKSEKDFAFGNFLLRLRAKSETNSRFLFYFVTSSWVQQGIERMVATTTYPNLNVGEYSSFEVPLPTQEEQRAIAAYLDRETERIDTLIEKKEELIELLEEKRTAHISRVVTKGLDEDAERQPSGIEPVGDVPAHWRVKRNKWVYQEAEERSEFGEEELLTVSHKTGITPRSEKEDVNMIEAESTEGYKICRPGDLVVNTMWAWKGALGISTYYGVVSPSYNVYRLREEERERIEPRYLDYLYRIPAYVTEIDRHSVGVWKSRLRLYPEAFFRMKTPLPPLREQKRVVRELDKEVERRNRLKEKVREAIDRLKEYRTALISAAVTGQIDVRGEVKT